MKRVINRYLVCLPVLFSTAYAYAASGEFSTLTYNVAGLPELLSSAESDRQLATEQISCYVNEFDVVNVQEDFNYHAALYDTCDNHPYRSPTSGGAGIGSGLNTMSRFVYEDWARVQWEDCANVDCLTPKGFTLARMQLQDGVFVDIYNLHTQAQTEENDLAARRANVLQLTDYIETHSAGNAVIIMGDTNTRYTRDGDNIREFLNRGFTDAWLDLIHTDGVPAVSPIALLCTPAVTDADCEIVDKILYRDNGYLQLHAYDYQVREDAINSDGQELSDHRPVETDWTYNATANWKFSTRIGGPHGTEFNDFAVIPEQPSVRKISIRAGSRVDQLKLTLDNGYVMAHGGDGGSEQSLTLREGEYLTSATLCTGKYNDHTRVFYAGFTTSQNRTLSGGSQTDSCSTFTADNGWSIVGFQGRGGDEIDKLGVIFAPSVATMNEPYYVQFINAASGLCLDITDADMSDGNNVELWGCSGGDWQQWNYDEYSGLIRSLQDPQYCLDNSGSFADGANLTISTCTGNANQRFTINTDGSISMRSMAEQVLDGYGTSAGDNVGTWTFWGGSNQYWQFN